MAEIPRDEMAMTSPEVNPDQQRTRGERPKRPNPSESRERGKGRMKEKSMQALNRTMTRGGRMGQSSIQLMSRGVSRANQKLDNDRRKMLRNALIRKQQFDNSLRLLESNPTRHNLQRAQSMKNTFVQKQIDERMEGHPPYFTRFITVFEFFMILFMMAFGELAPWGMGIAEEDRTVTRFDGSQFTYTLQIAENPYYGPDVETLVAWGSKWAPCMREDEDVLEFQDTTDDIESNFGCCVRANRECGQTRNTTCFPIGSFKGIGSRCEDHRDTCDEITIRPCCYGIYGQCAVITKSYCDAVKGSWLDSKENCVGNDCIFRQCGMGYDFTAVKASKETPNQFYRFITAMFLHVGVIHFVLNAAGQYVLVSQVEFVAGWWRTALMYLLSGISGFLISALFSADQLSNGASAAIYGMLGVETVDLFQTWQLLEDKTQQVVVLVIKLVIFLGIGTLPYIDNFAHVGGFAGGVVAAIWLLPYIVFGDWDALRKRMFQVMAALCLISVTIGLLAKFYEDKEIICSWCHYVNCVPYTEGSCDVTQESVQE